MNKETKTPNNTPKGSQQPVSIPLQQRVQVEEYGQPAKEPQNMSPQQQAQLQEHGEDSKVTLKATQKGLQSHRLEAGKHLSQTGRRFFELIEFDENEQLILEIRKHPFGLALTWLVGVVVSFVLLIVPVIIAAYLSNGSSAIITGSGVSVAQNILLVAGVLMAFAGIVVSFINSILYKNNVIFVTSEKIAQVLYISLFHRKISQLSIGDIQDVTVRQDGIFPRIFNYGTLTIETSGEQMNYVFNYVPAPYESSKLIVGAHESNLREYGN